MSFIKKKEDYFLHIEENSYRIDKSILKQIIFDISLSLHKTVAMGFDSYKIYVKYLALHKNVDELLNMESVSSNVNFLDELKIKIETVLEGIDKNIKASLINIDGVINNVENSKNAVDKIYSTSFDLKKDILDVIVDINSQINTFVLNAIINISNSGDINNISAVAEGFKNLLERTQKSTDSVKHIINIIMNDAGVISKRIENTKNIISTDEKLVDDVKKNFDSLASKVENISTILTSYMEFAKEQFVFISRVFTRVNNVNLELSNIKKMAEKLYDALYDLYNNQKSMWDLLIKRVANDYTNILKGVIHHSDCMVNLIGTLSDRTTFEATNYNECAFGKWCHSIAKSIADKNGEKAVLLFKDIENIHMAYHSIVSDILVLYKEHDFKEFYSKLVNLEDVSNELTSTIQLLFKEVKE